MLFLFGLIFTFSLFTEAKLVLLYELFFQSKSQMLLRQSVFILKVFFLINNQLLSTVNAKEINTDYYITNSTLAAMYHASVA